SAARHAGRSTTPAAALTTAGSGSASAASSMSHSRACSAATPLRRAIPAAVSPAAPSTASLSTRGRPSSPATSAPTVDLPAPMAPTSTRWSAPGIGRSGVGRCGRRPGDLERDLVAVAPPPVLARLVRPDDRVVAVGAEVGRGVPVGRAVAAADVPAGLADPQVEPAIAGAQAVLAAVRRGLHVADGVEV